MMIEDLLSQCIPASQRILNCSDSLNRVSERIIGPFHKTVKIWSSHLDIWPSTINIFCQGSDHWLQSPQFRNTSMVQRRARKLAVSRSGAHLLTRAVLDSVSIRGYSL
jgi:hypothetical protein